MKYNLLVVKMFFADCGLPPVETEHKFHPERRWRFDFAWLRPRVALEVEGGLWLGGRHNRASGMLKDFEKYNAAAELGWRILKCQPKDLCLTETAELIKRTLNQDYETPESRTSETGPFTR